MKKAIAVIAATAALSAGACSGASPESHDSFDSSAREKIANEQGPLADKFWEEGMHDFVDKFKAGQATLKVDKGNCDYFEEPEGSVIVKNPAAYSYTSGGAHIDFEVYGKGDADNHVLYNGPYVYTNDALQGDYIINQDPLHMKQPNDPVDMHINGVDTDGKSFWFSGSANERIGETIIVEHLPTGQIDNAKVDEASLSLCGLALGLNGAPGSTSSDQSHQPFTA